MAGMENYIVFLLDNKLCAIVDDHETSVAKVHKKGGAIVCYALARSGRDAIDYVIYTRMAEGQKDGNGKEVQTR